MVVGGVRSDRPRANREPAEIARKLALLDEPHVAPLSNYVRRLRARRGGDLSIPWFDPTEAGVHAKILLLFEAPGPRATASSGSGFISPDNNDGSAENVWWLLREAGCDRAGELVAWNAVPWYLGDGVRIRAATGDDLAESRAALRDLVALLPELRVVVLFGRPAALAWERGGLEVPAVRAPHPSPRNLNSRPHYRPLLLQALLQARWQAGLSDSPPAALEAIEARPTRDRRPVPVVRQPRAVRRVPASAVTDSEVDRDAIHRLLVEGVTADQIAARYGRRRDAFLVAVQEEARLEGELATFEATPEQVTTLREARGLRWERIAVRITGDGHDTALVRRLYDEANGPGASKRSYVGRGRRFPEMAD